MQLLWTENISHILFLLWFYFETVLIPVCEHNENMNFLMSATVAHSLFDYEQFNALFSSTHVHKPIPNPPALKQSS